MKNKNNYHFIYIAFLIIFGIGVIGVLTMDYEDRGDCRYTVNGEIQVRQPGSNSFSPTEHCIIIKN